MTRRYTPANPPGRTPVPPAPPRVVFPEIDRELTQSPVAVLGFLALLFVGFTGFCCFMLLMLTGGL